MSQQALHRP